MLSVLSSPLTLHIYLTSVQPIELMHKLRPAHGLYPIKVSISSGQFTDSTVTFGALGDSFYEYLLKLWLQGNRQEAWLRDMYDRAIDGVVEKLLKESSPSRLTFISDWYGGVVWCGVVWCGVVWYGAAACSHDLNSTHAVD